MKIVNILYEINIMKNFNTSVIFTPKKIWGPSEPRGIKQILICFETKTSYNSKKIELKSESVVRRCSVKKAFLKISKNSHESICAGVKRVWHRRFPVNCAEFSKTSIF